MNRLPKVALLVTGLATLACSALAGSQPTISPTVVTPDPRSAQLTEIREAVESQAEESTEWQPAAVGQTILTGGGARTLDESRARLDISDGTIVRIAANTTFRLTEFTPAFTDPVTQMALDVGKVWVWVTTVLGLGKFEVVTPSGVSGVRGSLMSVEYDPLTGWMTVTCLEGQCYLIGASGATTNLGSGEQAEILGVGLDPTPAHLMEAAQLVEWAQEFPEAQSAVATATAAPRPTATAAAQSACDHPYFPLRQGASWQRLRGSSSRTQIVESVSGDLSSANTTVTDSSGDTTLTYTWNCTAEGISYFRLEDISNMVATILTFYNVVNDFYSVDSASDVNAINYRVSNQAGVSLPAPADLQPGASWTHGYTIQYAGIPSAVPEAFINYTVDVSETHTVGDEQTLNTAAGAFVVIPVVVRTTGTERYEFSHGAPGSQIVGPNSEPFTSVTTVYYAKGVGIVRTEWTSDANSITSELETYSIP